MALPKLESRITVPSGNYAILVADTGAGGIPQAITAATSGYYFLTGTTSLLTTIKTALDASALNGTFTLTVDDTSDSTATGKVTISSTETFSLTWSSTALRDILGFSGNLSAASSYTATYHSKYIYLPNCGRSSATTLSPEPTSTSYELGIPEYDYSSTLSPSGYSTQLQYNTRYKEVIGFSNLKAYKTWARSEVSTYESLETFIQTMMDNGGEPFRYFPSRTDDTVSWKVFLDGFGVYQPTPVVPDWRGANSLWSIDMNVRKKL
jgi:hypothetical protein